MAKLVKNDKGFKVIKLSVDEAGKLGWGMSGSGDCICMQCNNPILGDIYYPVVLNDTMDKECYEEFNKLAQDQDISMTNLAKKLIYKELEDSKKG